MFRPLPPVPDYPALEEEILPWWDERDIFNRLRERNRGGPVWSFVDGPVTANKTLGVHGLGPHAEGRFPALQGAPWLRPALPERLRLSGPLD